MSIIDSLKGLFSDHVDEMVVAAVQKIGIKNIDATKLTGLIKQFGLENKIPANLRKSLEDGVITNDEIGVIVQHITKSSKK